MHVKGPPYCWDAVLCNLISRVTYQVVSKYDNKQPRNVKFSILCQLFSSSIVPKYSTLIHHCHFTEAKTSFDSHVWSWKYGIFEEGSDATCSSISWGRGFQRNHAQVKIFVFMVSNNFVLCFRFHMCLFCV